MLAEQKSEIVKSCEFAHNEETLVECVKRLRDKHVPIMAVQTILLCKYALDLSEGEINDIS